MYICTIVIVCATFVVVSSTPGLADTREKRATLKDWPSLKMPSTRPNSRHRRQSWPPSDSENWNSQAQTDDMKYQNQNVFETDQNNQSLSQTSDYFEKEAAPSDNGVDVGSRQSFSSYNQEPPPPPPPESRYDSQYERRPPLPNSYDTYDRRPPPPPPYDRRPPPRHDRGDDRPPPPSPSRYYEGKPPLDRRPPPPDHHYDHYSNYDRRPPPPPPDRGHPPRDHYDRRYERDDHWSYYRDRDYHRPYDKGPPPDHYHHRPPPPPDRGPPPYDRGPPPHHHGGPPPYDRGPPPRDRGPPSRYWGYSSRYDSFHHQSYDRKPPYDQHRYSSPHDRDTSYETSPNINTDMKNFTDSSGPLHEKLMIADDTNINSTNPSILPAFDQKQNFEPRDNIDIRSVSDKPFDIDVRLGFSDTTTNSYLSQDLYKSRFPPLFQVIPVTPES